MKPILFPVDATTFTTNGLGRMADAVSCRVTEERNGAYQLEMVYPVDGIHFADVAERMILYAIHDDRKDRQPFRIYEITRPMNGLVTIRARHISYDLNKIVVEPFTAGSCAAAMDGLRTHSATGNPFTFWTDKETVADFSSSVPAACRSLLGGSQGSILDVYGTGEYAWDHWTVKLYLHRGRDTGVTIRYGKNLTDLEDTVDVSGTYNAVYPYWYSEEEGLVELTEKVLYADLTDENGNPVDLPTEVSPLDLSSAWETKPTEEQLRQRAARHLTNNTPWEESRNIKVSFVALWQTEEYKDVAALERLCLCDTVTAIHKGLGVKAKKKIIKVVYDVLLERYQSMELGDTTKSFTSALKADIASQMDGLRESVPSKSFLAQSIERATDLLRGGMGGYVITVTNANGQPIEQLIVDNPDLSQATQVWRWNINGLGYSSTGYDGPYTSAITMDGHIVADFVDTGTLNANIIKAGILSDTNGNTTLNMTTGALSANKLSVSSPNFTLTESGIITAESAVLSNATINGKFVTDRAGVGRVEVDRGTVTIYSDQGTSSSGSNYVKCLDIAGSLAGGGACFLLNETIRFQEGLNSILDLYNEDGTSSSVLQSLPSYNAEKAVFGTGVYLERSYRQISSTQIETVGGHITMENDTGNGAVELYAGYWDDSTSAPILAIENGGGLYVSGTMSVDGSKHRLVETDSFGKVAMNAMESADCVFSDMGSGEIGEDGKVYIPFDPVFAETVNLNHEYQVFLTKTSDGVVDYVSKEHDSFSVIGDPGTTFDWIVYARQKGYVMERMERMSAVKAATKDDGQYYQPEDDGLEELASEYLEHYESEVESW